MGASKATGRRAASGDRSRARGALSGLLGCTLCATLAACSSAAPAPAPKAAAALPRVTVATAAPSVPLTPVIAPAESAQVTAIAKRLAALIDGSKPQVTPFTIDIASLPKVALPAQLDAKATAKLDRSKLTEDPGLTAKPADGYARQYMVTFTFKEPAKMTFGRVRVHGTYGANEGWFGAGYGTAMNIYQTCGKPGDLVPLHWETLSLDDGKLTYTVNEGALDRMSCTVLRATTATAVAKPLVPGGILFGFRSCEGTCDDTNEELTMLFPRSGASAAGALGGGAERTTGSFSRVSFPIQRGGGGAFLARIMKRDITPWQVRAPSAKEPEKTTPVLDDTIRLGSVLLPSFDLGVEVSQARDDEAPLAIAYMDVDPATLPPPPAPAPAPAIAAPVTSTTSAPLSTASPRIGFNLQLLDDRR